jgi:hypothetical protein
MQNGEKIKQQKFCMKYDASGCTLKDIPKKRSFEISKKIVNTSMVTYMIFRFRTDNQFELNYLFQWGWRRGVSSSSSKKK